MSLTCLRLPVRVRTQTGATHRQAQRLDKIGRFEIGSMVDLFVILIVGLCAAYIIRKFYKSFKKGENCDSTCSLCDIDKTCREQARRRR